MAYFQLQDHHWWESNERIFISLLVGGGYPQVKVVVLDFTTRQGLRVRTSTMMDKTKMRTIKEE